MKEIVHTEMKKYATKDVANRTWMRERRVSKFSRPDASRAEAEIITTKNCCLVSMESQFTKG
jgi:hypothetical protein